MTKENLELARSVIGDMAALFDLFDEYIVWDNRAHSPMDQLEPTFGRQAAINYVRKWVGTWTDFSFEVDELIDAGDSVLMVIHEQGKGKGSGLPMDHRYCMIWTFRNGRQCLKRLPCVRGSGRDRLERAPGAIVSRYPDRSARLTPPRRAR